MFNIPKFTETIIEDIEKAGFEAYLVGGCVRDLILGRTPNDWDIASSASPFDIICLFEKTVPTGIKYGTVTVFIKNEKAEVTAFRSEEEYKDSRRPSKVSFVSDIKTDLSRRDFTINSLAYNPQKGLVDPFGGRIDLKNKVIRTVGEPEKRFDEDALRILRAFRFSSQLGFEIDNETLRACKEKACNVENISGERIKTELDKILQSNEPEIIADVFKSGALDFIMNSEKKEFDAESLAKVPNKLSQRTAALFYLAEFINKEETFKCLHFSNSEKSEILFFIDILSRELPKSKADIKRLLKNIEEPNLLRNAFELVSVLKNVCADNCFSMLSEIENNSEPYTLKQLAISGNDLIEAGFNKGPQCGEILNMLLEKVIEEPIINDRKTLIATANSLNMVH